MSDAVRTIETYADDIHEMYFDHPWLTEKRIPLVRSQYHRWNYEVALVVPTPDTSFIHCEMPSEEEAEVIASYIDYRRAWYREGWAAKMLRHPLDTDSSTNGVTLIRRAESETMPAGWAFTRYTFDHKTFYPRFGGDLCYAPTKTGLIACIGKCDGARENNGVPYPGSRMEAWQAEHPEVWARS